MTNNPTDEELRDLHLGLNQVRWFCKSQAHEERANEHLSSAIRKFAAFAEEGADAITTLIEYRQQVQDLKDAAIDLLDDLDLIFPEDADFRPSFTARANLRRATLTKESRV